MWLHKFKLLLWKNWILVKRHPIAAIFEIIFPILVVMFFTWGRQAIEPTIYPEIHYKPFDLFPLGQCKYGNVWEENNTITKIGFSPNTDFYEKIVQAAVKKKPKLRLESIGFPTAEELNLWIRNTSATESIAGIEFDPVDSMTSKQLRYTIRMPQNPLYDTWMTDQLFYVSPSKRSRSNQDSNMISDIPPYHGSCFLGLQNEIDHAFIQSLNKTAQMPSIVLNNFPYPTVTEDIFIGFAIQAFPLLFVMCMLLAIKNIIKNVALERESQLKESMKMMGLTSSQHWCSWFTKSFIMLIIPFTINCVLMTTTLLSDIPMFEKSNPLIIWLFLVAYIVSVVTFSFLAAVLFKKSSTATNAGTIIYFVAILPFTYFGEKFHSFPYILKVVFALLPNSNMATGVMILLNSEGNEDGIGIMNLFKRNIDLKFSFGELLFFMILSSIILMCLTVYIERVFPGDIGISSPWYYPIMPFVKFMKKQIGYDTLSNESVLQERRISHPDYEEEPENLQAGIRIVNLSKKFGDKFAVEKLCLNMFENQITVLLGHNGAGKTTTMSCLTGLFSPTSGTAFVNSKDIRSELDEARKSLGICAQHNILFDELTIREHLIFFCTLKGMTDNRLIAEEIKRYTNLLGIEDKIDAESKVLSGGQKRRLSIAIALCGDAKIVILDEPTSGMDPTSRRELWDLLLTEKRGRTILLSTHFMDEADQLGDRIAIMSEGRLRTVGSSFYLKKKFGTGYRLVIVKKEGFQSISILNLLNEYAPEAYLESENQTEAIFVINEECLPSFQNIFKKLEDNSKKLRISTFGCNLSTLEEIFLKLGVEDINDGSDDLDHSHHSGQHENIDMPNFDLCVKIQGFQLIAYQIEAIFLKKFHVFRRTWKTLLCICIFSIWTIVFVMSAPRISFIDTHPLKISLNSYEETQTVLQNNESPYFKSYQSLFTGKDKFTSISSDFTNYILKEYNKSFANVNSEYLIGATVSENSIIAWFNGQPFHTMPLTINTINRALVKLHLGQDADITVTNMPFNMPIHDSENHIGIYENPVDMVFALGIIFFLLTYWPVIFVAPYIKERESRAKLLQYISGTNRFVYWLTSFIFDYVIFVAICCGIIACIGIYQHNHFATFSELCVLVVISCFYAFAMLPLIYAMTYLFTKHSTGETIVSLFSILLGIAYGLWKLGDIAAKGYGFYSTLMKITYWILLFFAPFSLVDMLQSLGFSYLTQKSIFTFEDDGIMKNILINFQAGILFLGFCLLKDYNLFEWIYYRILSRPRMLPLFDQNIDADVDAEIQKVKEMGQDQIRSSNLVMKGLTKYYGNFLAVNQLYLDVEHSECFGLLGINGAGKTSVFKMLVADELISAGDVFIRGFSMKNDMHKVFQLIGYCPQFDAIIPELTCEETLKIFSLIRGIPRQEINETIRKMANDLGFQQHLKKQVKNCSGGNKRKLSTCLSILGYPQLIFLDEPTTGIDPAAKRKIWDVINKIRNSGRAVVITSHSMDECEALCSKIGIMVNGQFKCLGPVQYLKNKYSKGFVLTIKMGSDSMDLALEIQNVVADAFPSSEFKEKYLDILTFHITNTDLKWSEVFSRCAQMKEKIDIGDYAVSQMSLEQVFILFSKSGIYQNNII